MPPLYSASSFMNRAPRAKRQAPINPPVEEVILDGPEFLTVSFFADKVKLAGEGLAGLGRAEPEEEPQPEMPLHDADAPVDFLGRLLAAGDVVEALRTLYRNQGEDVKVVAGWRGVVVRLDGAGDALVDFGDRRSKRWIRRKHLGSLKKPEEHELDEIYGSSASALDASFRDAELLEDQCSSGPARRKSEPLTFMIGTPRETSPSPVLRSRQSC